MTNATLLNELVRPRPDDGHINALIQEFFDDDPVFHDCMMALKLP